MIQNVHPQKRYISFGWTVPLKMKFVAPRKLSLMKEVDLCSREALHMAIWSVDNA